MEIFNDCFGRLIRLTGERMTHILLHPELKGMEVEIPRIPLHPEVVRRSRTDPDILLFYRFFAKTWVGGKWLCVVVKYVGKDAFVVTAYLTGKPKTGEDLWPVK